MKWVVFTPVKAWSSTTWGVIFGPDFLVRDGKVVTNAKARAKGDKSIQGFKGLLKMDRGEALAKADEIIKNTYRTLMTRGQKGCFIYSEDPEAREYFKKALVGRFCEPIASTAVLGQDSKPQVLDVRFEKKSDKLKENLCPVFNLKAAAGLFSEDQWDFDADYIQLPEPHRAQAGDFVVQVVGNSMNRIIPDGAWCLFRRIDGGTRDGKIVLVQSRFLQEEGAQYTVKRYKSEKHLVDNELWEHRKIVLTPHSTDPSFQPMVLEDHQARELKVIGEFVAVLDLENVLEA